VKAQHQGLIEPLTTLSIPQADLSFDKCLLLEAGWRNIPAAVFPHGRLHTMPPEDALTASLVSKGKIHKKAPEG
jgi:hypothetical protein